MHRIGEKRRLFSDSSSDLTYYSESPPKKKKYLRTELTGVSSGRSRLYGLCRRVASWVMSVFTPNDETKGPKEEEDQGGVAHMSPDWTRRHLSTDGDRGVRIPGITAQKLPLMETKITYQDRSVGTRDQDTDGGTMDEDGGTRDQDRDMGTRYQDRDVGTRDQDRDVGTRDQDRGVGTRDQDRGVGTRDQDRGVVANDPGGLVMVDKENVLAAAADIGGDKDSFSGTRHFPSSSQEILPTSHSLQQQETLPVAVDPHPSLQAQQGARPAFQTSPGLLQVSPRQLYSPRSYGNTPKSMQSHMPHPLCTQPPSMELLKSKGTPRFSTLGLSQELKPCPLHAVPLFSERMSPVLQTASTPRNLTSLSNHVSSTDYISRTPHTREINRTSIKPDHSSRVAPSLLKSGRSDPGIGDPVSMDCELCTMALSSTPTMTIRPPLAAITEERQTRLAAVTNTKPAVFSDKGRLETIPASSLNAKTSLSVVGERNMSSKEPQTWKVHSGGSRKTEMESLSNWIQDIQRSHKHSQTEREVMLEVARAKLELCQQQRQEVEEELIGRLRQTLQDSHLDPQQAMPWQLSPDQMDKVAMAMGTGSTSECLSERYRIRICRSDLYTLEPTAWLNDEIMNFYFNLVQEHCNEAGQIKVHIFNSFFYLKLSQTGYAGVRRWTKKVDLFGCDLILLPVHLGMHWCLAVVDMRAKQFLYLDSLLGSNVTCLQRLRDYLVNESQDKKKVSLNLADWTDVIPKNIPRQENSWDCGVFTCMYARYKALQQSFPFSQSDMPAIRKLMVYEILQQKLKL